jgi:hypothetical protein
MMIDAGVTSLMLNVFAPRNMTPYELQRATLRAYRRFYSTHRLVANALALRIQRTKEQGWCWWFVRSWHVPRSNREYWRWLKRLRLPRGGTAGAAAGRADRQGRAAGAASGSRQG